MSRKKSKLTKTSVDQKMRAAKCCTEQGHSDLFTYVLTDLESIFDLGCPENSQKFLFFRSISQCGGGRLGGVVPPRVQAKPERGWDNRAGERRRGERSNRVQKADNP